MLLNPTSKSEKLIINDKHISSKSYIEEQRRVSAFYQTDKVLQKVEVLYRLEKKSFSKQPLYSLRYNIINYKYVACKICLSMAIMHDHFLE